MLPCCIRLTRGFADCSVAMTVTLGDAFSREFCRLYYRCQGTKFFFCAIRGLQRVFVLRGGCGQKYSFGEHMLSSPRGRLQRLCGTKRYSLCFRFRPGDCGNGRIARCGFCICAERARRRGLLRCRDTGRTVVCVAAAVSEFSGDSGKCIGHMIGTMRLRPRVTMRITRGVRGGFRRCVSGPTGRVKTVVQIYLVRSFNVRWGACGCRGE